MTTQTPANSAAVSPREAAALLLANDDILIITHKNPDGDTLGSGFALYAALAQKGKRAAVVCSGELPKKYARLLAGYIADEAASAAILKSPGYVVTVDTASTSLIGLEYLELGKNADLCIDHHATNSRYAKNTLVDAKKASCSEIILAVLDEMGAELTEYIAECIYTGISTDTGCFKFRNTTAGCHRDAARMIERGIDMAEINRIMFEQKSRARIELERRALAEMQFYLGDQVAVITITQDMIGRAGATDSDIEGLTSLPRSIEGVEVGVTMRETKTERCKVSVRTLHIDAAKICERFGGGGHFGAAGFECTGEFANIKHLLLQEIETQLAASC